MKAVLLVALTCVVFAHCMHAEKAPLSPNALVQEADLIVVGKIDELRIETERSQIERRRGNYDWAIYLTITVDTIEKGTFSGDELEVRCFRIKSRRSMVEFFTPSGNRPIPNVGTRVKAFLYGSPGSWKVIFPNGLKSPDAGLALSNAPQVERLRSHRYTYLLPEGAWWLLLIVAILGFLVRWLVRMLLKRRRATDLPG